MKAKNREGLSLIELVIAMAMASILVLVAGILLLGSNRAYLQTYASIHDPMQQDSRALTAAFGAICRKSNRTNYTVYKMFGNSYIEAVPDSGSSIATGQAVEFRYWDKPFYELSQDMDRMDVADTGTNYALFYLSGEKLYVDYGTIVDDVGGIDGGFRKTSNIETQCLVQQVDTSENSDIFIHEIVGGAGNGCISLNLTLINDEAKTMDIKMAALVRVVWPK